LGGAGLGPSGKDKAGISGVVFGRKLVRGDKYRVMRGRVSLRGEAGVGLFRFPSVLRERRLWGTEWGGGP